MKIFYTEFLDLDFAIIHLGISPYTEDKAQYKNPHPVKSKPSLADAQVVYKVLTTNTNLCGHYGERAKTTELI